MLQHFKRNISLSTDTKIRFGFMYDLINDSVQTFANSVLLQIGELKQAQNTFWFLIL